MVSAKWLYSGETENFWQIFHYFCGRVLCQNRISNLNTWLLEKRNYTFSQKLNLANEKPLVPKMGFIQFSYCLRWFFIGVCCAAARCRQMFKFVSVVFCRMFLAQVSKKDYPEYFFYSISVMIYPGGCQNFVRTSKNSEHFSLESGFRTKARFEI